MSRLHKRLDELDAVDGAELDDFVARLAGTQVPGLAARDAADTAISMVDLTTLEATDTPSTVRAIARTALRPDPDDHSCPSVAAVCVYPDLVSAASGQLAGSPVRVASVAGAFPSGRATLDVKLADVRSALDAGAGEVDVVVDRGAFLDGNEQLAFDQLSAMRDLIHQVAGADVPMKVILEIGELGTYDNVQRASWLAMLAGADFIKTSTGKIQPGASLPAATIMLRAVRDYGQSTGRHVGVKASGGIRSTEQALRYLTAVHQIAGPGGLTAGHFRFGASSLLQDLLAHRRRATASG